jgi:polyhydroxyalkanoate depolymerase
MLYQLYQTQTDLAAPFRHGAGLAASWLAGAKFGPPGGSLHKMAAAYELISWFGLTHTRPAFGIASVRVGNAEAAITEEPVLTTPFATLLHFKKDTAAIQPRLIVVAPMSGHFSTLLRDTVRTVLQDHDVYVTDWHNARDVPLSAGRFGFDDYVEHLMRFLRFLGPGTHMLAICQPSVPALAAAAVMAADGDPAQPRSLVLMAGPIDTRISPTKVNQLAQSKPLDWFERRLIGTVPRRHAGGGRAVYPGFVQLLSFMSMNPDRHRKALLDLFYHEAKGETDKAEAIRRFYDEYLAVMDMPAEFFLETIRAVFQDHDLPRGRLTWRGNPVDPGAMRKTGLLTVEGERDDICAIGQTLAAQELCPNLRPYKRRHHVQTGVGHYGVFSGRRWSGEIYPIVRDFIYDNA